MDIQSMVDPQMKVMRESSFRTSDQITLGQLIKKLKDCQDKDGDAVVFFQFDLVPCSVDSWRGSYCELAIEYKMREDDDLLLSLFIKMLEDAVGKTFQGYKGGDYTMTEYTPVWAANYGISNNTAIVDVHDTGYGYVYIQTKHIEY